PQHVRAHYRTLMAKFSNPLESTYVSQYVPLPADTIIAAGQQIQERHDEALNLQDTLQAALAQASAIEKDQAYLEGLRQRVNDELESMAEDGLYSRHMRRI